MLTSAAFLIRQPIEDKVNQLLSQMTLPEKVGQLNQINGFDDSARLRLQQGEVGSILNLNAALPGPNPSPAVIVEAANAVQRMAVNESRLGIPLLFGRDVIHGFRTVFPIPLAQAAAWDPATVEQGAAIAADEATSQGVKWTFAPMVDIARDPRWGRVAEGAGEDPFLGSAIAAAAVRGFQGEDLSDPRRLLACAKHFVGYGGAQGGRDYESVEMSVRTLRDVYLPPFHAAVRQGVATLMAAFHDLNGIPLNAHRELLTDLLRAEWGFKGFVVSDWRSVIELVNHGIAADPAEAAYAGLVAGVDMDMVSDVYRQHLPELVADGHLSEAQIHEAARRILRLKFLAGLFENPYTDPARHRSTLLKPEYLQFARQFARQTMVLLKNEQLLPIDGRFKRILFTGPFVHARGELLGTWNVDGRAEDVTPLSQAVREIAPTGHELFFVENTDEALHLAQHVDLVVALVGEHPSRSGENRNVSDLSLPPGQTQLVQALADLGVPLAVVVFAGRPLAIPHETRLADALLYAWHPGSEGGFALADLLFGLAQPSGRLPITIPRRTGQVPIYYAHKPSGRPVGSTTEFLTRYVDLPYSPLFPFGFGLGYTSFTYHNLEISEPHMTGETQISAEVTNQGSLPGIETAQLYLRDVHASVARPVKELKGFQRLELQPGETRRVTFTVSATDLVFTSYNDLPRVEPGDYQVWIGPNSTAGLQGSFTLDI
jgi:beta-glucosidase